MKIGVCVRHEGDIVQKIRDAHLQGFDNCQLISWDTTRWTQDEAALIRETCQKERMEISAFWCGWSGPKVWDFEEGPLTLGIVPESFRFQRMQELMRGADFARLLGVEDVVTHAGFIPENPLEGRFSGVVAALRAIAEHLKANGQNFLFETGQETPVTLLRAIESVGTGNLYINLDPANLILYGKANPVDALDVFGRYVRGVHAKDGVYPVDGENLGLEKPLGEGKVDFPQLLHKLKALGYERPITIEREIDGDEQLRDIQKGRALLEKILSSL